jgi:hypothetical protein
MKFFLTYNLSNKILIILSFLVLVFIPFDSIPILPSVYRPLSLIPMVVVFPFLIFKKIFRGFETHEFFLILFILLSIFISYFQSLIRFNNLSGFFDSTITLLIGFGFYIIFDYLFNEFKKNYKDDYISQTLKIIGYIFLIPLLFGIVEIFTLLNLVDPYFKNTLLSWISGRSTSRIQMFSGEPAWAATQLSFLIPIYLSLSHKSFIFKILMLISFTLLVFTFSINGILILTLSLILFILRKFTSRKLIYIIVSVFLFIILIPFVIYLLQTVFPTPIYFINRIIAILQGQFFDFSNFLYRDGSTFIRIGYPIIGFYAFILNPVFGVGIGNFRFVFPSVINQYFSNGLIFPEVQNGIEMLIANPKMLLSRVLSETGLLGFFLLYKFLKPIYNKIILSKNHNTVFFLFLVMLNSTLQFDSFAFVFLWLFIAFFNNISVYNHANGGIFS